MSLKSKISKADYDALSDELKGHYIAEGDGYKLDTTEARELLAAKQQEKERADKLTRDLATVREEMESLKTDLEAAQDAKRRKENDIPSIEAAWQKKIDDQKKKDADTLKAREDQLRTLLVRNEAIKIAHEISTAPELLLPHLMSRMAADLEGETPKTIILGEDGKRSAKNLDEFKQEVVDNPLFAAIIIGSKASGGSADQRRANGGSAPSGEILKMSESDRIALHRKIGDAEFNRRVAEESNKVARH